MGSIFRKKINEPPLDTLSAKRILENALYECGMKQPDESFEEIVERLNMKSKDRHISLIEKGKNMFRRSGIAANSPERNGAYAELDIDELGLVYGGSNAELNKDRKIIED